MIEKDESFYFCEKCAIPLITNGFKLIKIGEPEPAENPRIKEINEMKLTVLEIEV